ncbi:MAG: sigma-70 family RNA polymerase sigma factor [Candidatus Hydrogenedentota bacterium]
MGTPLKILVLNARDGDRDAFSEIMDRFRENAHARAYGVLKDYHLAQDVVQEAFAEAFFSLDKLNEPAAFPGWFKRIVIKRIDRVIRRKKHPTTSIEMAYDLAGDDATQDEAFDREDLGDTLDVALASLPQHEQDVARDYYLQEKSQKEIAEDLDVPVTTIKKRLYSSRQRLKEQLKDLGPLDAAIENGNALTATAQLFSAARNGFVHKIHHLLMNEPELVEARNDDGLNILLYAAHAGHHSGNPRVAEVLLSRGASLDLSSASALGFSEKVRYWIHRNPQRIHERGLWGRTPLHWAISGGHVELAEWLLGHGAAIEATDHWGCTPLHLAAELGQRDSVDLLVGANANVHAQLKNGKSILHLAAQSGDVTIVETLLRDKARLDVFTVASLGLKDQMKRLLKQDPYLIKARLPFGATPLHTAAEDGQFEMAHFLVEEGAELDMVSAAELGWTDEVHSLLNEQPRQVNEKGGSFGYTALHTAISKGKPDIARLLLVHGASVNATDDMYQKTPLGEALYFGNEAMAHLLYHHGGEE